ncbi:MAG: sugar phosphate isomerase/epimerase [Geobacteraceae bacterium]|nr:sugar phosphate isomerase/epimerase [Geobacteraceae bacterium]
MPSLLCAHIPWPRLAEHRAYLLEERINPELYLPADSLDTLDKAEVQALADDLVSHGLSCTIHATFMDLNPGSVDRAVRETTRQRVEQTLDCAEMLQARVVVFHPGYSRLSYGSAVEIWTANTVAFWQQQLSRIRQAGCKVALENIFEEEPSTLLQVLKQLDRTLFGHCFDSGHFNMFCTVSLEEWFAALGSFIIESHLHDNHGVADEHLPVGEGEIDFQKVTDLLKQYAPQAVWTLEAHSRERLERSMQAIQRYL